MRKRPYSNKPVRAFFHFSSGNCSVQKLTNQIFIINSSAAADKFRSGACGDNYSLSDFLCVQSERHGNFFKMHPY